MFENSTGNKETDGSHLNNGMLEQDASPLTPIELEYNNVI